MKNKMRHLVFENEVHVWTVAVTEREFIFLKRKRFLDQMKSYKCDYPGPTEARAKVSEIALRKIKTSKFHVSLMQEIVDEIDKIRKLQNGNGI